LTCCGKAEDTVNLHGFDTARAMGASLKQLGMGYLKQGRKTLQA